MGSTGAQLLLGGASGIDLLDGPYQTLVGTDWGMWQAVTTASQSLFTDGSIVAGETSDNRTVKLQVKVSAAKGWRTSLIAACEALFAAANLQSNELWFIPADGPTVVYEVFRAQPTRTDDQSDAFLFRMYELTFPARPFTRSADPLTLTVTAPTKVLEDFETAPSGVDLSATAGGWNALTALFDGVPAGLIELVNCTGTIATGSGFGSPAVQLTAIANGLVEAAQDVEFGVSGAVVAVRVGGFWGGSTPPSFVAGIEWRDASDTLLRVDYSDAQPVTQDPNASRDRGPFFAAPRPSTATKARIRMRVPSGVAGTTYTFTELALSDVAAYTLDNHATLNYPDNAVSTAHDGTGGLHVVGEQGYAYATLPSPLDISAAAALGLWLIFGTGVATSISVTLYDSSGRWSRWSLTFTSDHLTWQHVAVDLSTPTASGSDGAAVLTAISAWSITCQTSSGASCDVGVDTLLAGALDSASITEYGQVAQPGVTGSARSTVAVSVLGNSATVMDDMLVAVAAAGVSPMLSVFSSVATAPSPAAYSGVYRVLASVIPAAAQTSPTCVVEQMVAGVSVATQTLTGTMTDGNRYCDFGAVALPLVGVPKDNRAVSYTFTMAPSGSAWAQVLVLDVDQPMVWLPQISPAHKRVWIDEPDGTAQLGRVWVGDNADRSDARSPVTPPDLSRPFTVVAPMVNMLIYSTSGAPSVEASPYYPRWLVEPTE